MDQRSLLLRDARAAWSAGETGPAEVAAISAAREAPDVVQRRPDGGIELLQAEVGGDEAVATVDADGGADEHAIDVDDVRLQHRSWSPSVRR